MHLAAKVKQFGAIALVAGALAACHSSSKEASKTETVVPKMGVVSEEIAGHQRLFSTFGFWMMGEPLKTQLLGCYRPDGTLDQAKLKATFPDANIVAGAQVTAVALPSGDFTFFLLRDGPLVSLDPKFDAMVQQMSAKAYTTP